MATSVSFISERDYGNSRIGTAGTIRQQLWVAAIKNSPVPGEDPSFVPYWLPGQTSPPRTSRRTGPRSLAVRTARLPDVASQCCSNVISNGVCATPMECIPAGQTCGGGGCCGGLVCSQRLHPARRLNVVSGVVSASRCRTTLLLKVFYKLKPTLDERLDHAL